MYVRSYKQIEIFYDNAQTIMFIVTVGVNGEQWNEYHY